MPNLNKVMLMGNLTRDPELRYTPNNTPVVNLGLAVNRRWRNQQGEVQEETTFVDCEAWSRAAEVINQYLRKGRPVFIEGRLKLDQWQDKDGQNRSKLKVIVENFQFLDSRSDGGDDGGHRDSGSSGYQGSTGYQGRRSNRPAPGGGGDAGSNPSNPGHHAIDQDDIPF